MVELILASGSAARRQMLAAAGVPFRVVPADVDEAAVRAGLGDTEPAEVARVLARAKAEAVSRQHPAALVIGADQVLALGQQVHAKAPDVAAARRVLSALAGRTHRLISAVALAEGGAIAWSHADSAALTMRSLSDAFLDDYLARAGERVLASVGCYELEGLGVQLLERVDGDYFTVLGLPLLPLLAALRARGVLAT